MKAKYEQVPLIIKDRAMRLIEAHFYSGIVWGLAPWIPDSDNRMDVLYDLIIEDYPDLAEYGSELVAVERANKEALTFIMLVPTHPAFLQRLVELKNIINKDTVGIFYGPATEVTLYSGVQEWKKRSTRFTNATPETITSLPNMPGDDVSSVTAHIMLNEWNDISIISPYRLLVQFRFEDRYVKYLMNCVEAREENYATLGIKNKEM